MEEAGKDRPKLIFRKTSGNRHTLPRLLGIIEGEGLNADFNVQLGNSEKEIIQWAGDERAIIGFSFMTPHLMEVKAEVERLRKGLGEKAMIIAGGPNATGDPLGTLHLGFDYVFAGESDQIFPDFLRQYLDGKVPEAPIISGERGTCALGVHPPFSFEHRFFAPVEITRGCRYSCHFCQTPRIFGHRLRHREIRDFSNALKRAYPIGYRQVTFITPNAFAYGAMDSREPNLSAMEELLGGCLDTGALGVHFGCYPSEVRPDWVNPEVLRLVKKYCRNQTIVLGAQSGSDTILSALHRGHTAEQGMNAARLIHQAGFTPHVDFVFGFPDETIEDRRLSISMIDKMLDEYDAKIHAHVFMPLPGTPLFRKNPSKLDPGTKSALWEWERKGKLDGWWKDQAVIGGKIVEWRDQGIIKGA
jgi:B12-binding domain/radical SAM domain protein